MTLEAWLVTDVGVVREHNEDSAYMEPANGFFIVADGMGGHAAGEVASAMAVDTVRKTLEGAHREIESFKRAPTDAGRRALVQLLQSAVLSAHQAVFQRGQHEADKAGMGTTLDVVLIAGPEAFVAHVGDSRTYLVRDGRSSQITTDHTVAEVLVIEGKLTIEEAQVSPLRTILVNAIGVSADVGVEMAHVTLKRGDRLLLCSDGLHDYFPSEDEIAQKLSTDAPGTALKDMVELAKTRGGHDNITGVAVQVTDVFEAVPGQLDSDLTQPVELHGANPFASDEPTETALVEPASVAPRPATSVTPPHVSPSHLKATQPMRIVEDEEDGATADTIPPGAARPAVAPEAPATATAAPGSDDQGDQAARAAQGAAGDAARPGNAGSAGEPASAPTKPAPGDKDHVKADAAPDQRDPDQAGGETGEEPGRQGDAPQGKADRGDMDDIADEKLDETVEVKPVAAGARAARAARANPASDHDPAAPGSGGSKPDDSTGGPAGAPGELASADTGRVSVPSKDKGTG
ncbi:MAG TPA: protein phosphatase 2C domain-containing protein [Kofleriaceae bacterium]|nr:protein phosphatase 2C domain-containing protein [Kofleriaceae bacterium]